MENISVVAAKISKAKTPIEKACKVHNYLKTKKKFEFVQEYQKLLEEHKDDYEGMIDFIGFVFFHILLVKYYTDIDVEFTYECFDSLMETDIIDNVIAYMKKDYKLLIRFCDLNLKEKGE